jgi:prevent-host-death family protein
MKTVPAGVANRTFSKLLAEAEAGEEIVITRRGVAVAKLLPMTDRIAGRARKAAVRRMIARMERGAHLSGAKMAREEIYKR